MSLVYKGYDLENRREVAVKLMKKTITSVYFEDLIRFKREIEIVRCLDHPNIAKIYSSGEYKNIPYIIMELLDGENNSDSRRNKT